MLSLPAPGSDQVPPERRDGRDIRKPLEKLGVFLTYGKEIFIRDMERAELSLAAVLIENLVLRQQQRMIQRGCLKHLDDARDGHFIEVFMQEANRHPDHL